MAKMIKFNLTLGGVTVSTFDELQDNFSPEILSIYRTGRLLKWLQARELNEQTQAVQAITPTEDDHTLLGALCHALGLQADPEVITFMLEDWKDSNERHTAQAASVEAVKSHTGSATTDGAEDDAQEETHTSSGAAVDWSGQDMRGRNFEGEDFSYGKFVGTDFSGSTLKRANFTGADLTGAKFIGGDFSECIFAKADLTDASFGASASPEAAQTDLQGSIFVGALFHNTSFKNANLEKCNFSKTEIVKMDFSTCYLGMANFESADLSFSDLSARFRERRLFEVNLDPNSRTGTANFSNARLTGVTGLTRSQAEAMTKNYAA